MNKLSVIALLSLLLLASSPAHGKTRTTFPKAQTFQECTETTMFACNKRTPSGQRYGTAHTSTMCSKYVFHSDGTVTLSDYMGLPDPGRYRIKGDTVFIQRLDRDGKVVGKFNLELSNGGNTLGKMKRLASAPRK